MDHDFTLKRDITVALLEEKYPDWDPYLAAKAVRSWYLDRYGRGLQTWMENPAVEILCGPVFMQQHHNWDSLQPGAFFSGPFSRSAVSYSSIRFRMGFSYMRTRILLWQFVDGCFQSGFVPVKAPWEP